MGSCLSKYRLRRMRGLLHHSDEPAPHMSILSPEFLASTQKPTACWGKEQQPGLFLGNNSGYRISYWVTQEDKKRNKAHEERIATSMGLHLNLGSMVTGGGLRGGVKREKEKLIETEEGGVYFLMRDHRMGPRGETQPTQVPFPADCREVRVYGFFEEDGDWRPYKDKVYSIGRGKKSFTLNALDSNIAPYAKNRKQKKQIASGEKVEKQPLVHDLVYSVQCSVFPSVRRSS